MVTSRGIVFIFSTYLTFAVDSITSNLALIADKHNIKSAPKEHISLRIPHVTVVLRHKFYSFLIMWVMFTFRGCTCFLTTSKYNFLVFKPIVYSEIGCTKTNF